MLRKLVAVAVAVLLLAGSRPVDAAEKLRVGITPLPPLVIVDSAEPKGFFIDVWRAVARELDMPFEFVVCNTVDEKLRRIEQKELDAGVGAIMMTSDRERQADFTCAFFHTGFDILVRREGSLHILWNGLTGLFTGTRLALFAVFLIIIFIAGNLMWLIERDKEMFHKKYFRGVFEGIYWAIVTVSTVGYGDKTPIGCAGRLLAMLVILCVLPIFLLITAELTSAFTVERMRTHIHGPEDLAGRDVAVLADSPGERAAHELHARLHPMAHIEQAYAALLAHAVDAVVADTHVLRHYAHNVGKGHVVVVGKIFRERDFGIAVPLGSPLRKRINEAILRLSESGELEQIERRWLGND
ncbi:MAG: transporter substrate-binding domain-containing protein [Planctomycetota bacterium]